MAIDPIKERVLAQRTEDREPIKWAAHEKMSTQMACDEIKKKRKISSIWDKKDRLDEYDNHLKGLKPAYED